MTRLQRLFCASHVVVDIVMAESGVIFTLKMDNSYWDTAKANCEALGQRLAVLDTSAKQSALEAQM